MIGSKVVVGLAIAAGAGVLGCATKSEPGMVSTAASQMGTSGALADFDGDGLADLLVGAPYARGSDTLGAVLVHRRTSAGFDAAPTWTLIGDDNTGSQIANVGDVDGDGRDDFAVAATNGNGPEASLAGSVTVYRGGTSGQILRKLGGEQALDKFGASVTGRCDLDGDGKVDLVIGATGHSPGPDRYLGGAYYVYFGPDLSDARQVKIPATLSTGILGFASGCGDVNADGVDDLVVSAIWTHGVIWHTSKVLVFYGKTGFAADPDSADLTVDSTATHFGDSLAVIGDLDGDGYRDIAIGVPSFYAIPAPSPTNPMTSLRGRVFVVKGGTGKRTVNLSAPPGTPIPALLTTLTGQDYLERFGSAIASLGDLDSDGKPDFAVSAPHGHAAGATSLDSGWVSGRVYVYLGKDVSVTGTPTPYSAARLLTRPGRTLHFGAFLEPFTQDGPRLLVGAPTANRQTGTVFVEDLAAVRP
jgi:hypothetical protein